MYVISTAGHVDHGKSTLIERLSGIDPDRLAEEKARGLTIDLGFAWLTLPSGRDIGIVDVPGHERFVHNMLAGVGSVDTTLFVVAANEGWMPQSEEHLAILDLLGARAGVVALTKADLVDARTLEAARDAVARRLDGTALAGAPIVPVSAVTGDGIEPLLRALDDMLARAATTSDRGRARVCIDRSFTIKGAGTVITGTLTGGSLHVGDEVEILPAGRSARIRSIQTHKASRDQAVPVSRVALNLAGLDRAEVARGDVVVRPGSWRATRSLDVRLRGVRGLDHELTNRGSYKLYVGSAEVDARLRLLDVAALRRGEEAFARLALRDPVVAAPFDRVVLRDTGRRSTVAGGVVLDPHPVGRPDVDALRARAAAGADDIPTLVVAERGVVALADLPVLAGSSAAPSEAVTTRSFAFAKRAFDDMGTAIREALRASHASAPLAQGMPRDALRAAAQIADARVFVELIESLEDVITEGTVVRLASHHVSLTPEQDAARARLLDELEGCGFSPPPYGELLSRYGAALVRALVDAGVLVRVSSDLAFSDAQLARAKDAIREAFSTEGPLTAARIKELLATSRKFAIPLLEYLDANGFTRRRGDLREVVSAG